MTPQEFKTAALALAEQAEAAFGANDPRVAIARLAASYDPTAPDAPDYQQRHDRATFHARCQNVLMNL